MGLATPPGPVAAEDERLATAARTLVEVGLEQKKEWHSSKHEARRSSGQIASGLETEK